MLTESQARTLLHQAADTVEVAPAGPIVAPPRRRTPLVAGAAALAVAAVVALVIGVAGGPSGHAPTGPGSASPTAQAHGILSVFGYTGTGAVAMLRAAGLDPRVEPDLTCREVDGRALRTRPSVGTAYHPGDPVTVIVARTPAAADCSYGGRYDAWSLVDLATGRGDGPTFAREVTLSANGRQVTVTADRARDPAGWPACPSDPATRCPGTALDVLAAAATGVRTLNGQAQQPELMVDEADPRVRYPELALPRPGRADAFTIGYPTDGVDLWPRWTIVVHHADTVADRVDGVYLVWQDRPALTTVPDLTGRTARRARHALEAAGLTARVVPPPATNLCIGALPPVVRTQEPAASSRVTEGSTVTMTMRWVLCGERRTSR